MDPKEIQEVQKREIQDHIYDAISYAFYNNSLIYADTHVSVEYKKIRHLDISEYKADYIYDEYRQLLWVKKGTKLATFVSLC